MTEHPLIKFSNKIQNFQECADSHEILCFQTGPHAKIFIEKILLALHVTFLWATFVFYLCMWQSNGTCYSCHFTV